MTVITIENISYTYPGRSCKAVDDVSFMIEKGAYTAIVGSNGSGKSTLARILCGLENPDSGKILVSEGNRIGVVFQSPKEQIVSSIVSRDTAFGPLNIGLSPAEVELRSIESLSLVEMLDRSDSSTAALSLGQTQKIALSGMIAMHPEILILDEAVSMLDPVSRDEILQFLKRWQKYGNTIIHITHDLDVVKQADNVVGMDKGKVFYYGNSKAFLENPDNVYRLTGEPFPVISKSLLAEKKDKEITVSLENICFSYDKKSGVRNISFDLFKGTVTALTGPSGAGKSTILELMSGLAVPDKGTIRGSRGVLAQQNAQSALFENFAADDVAFGPRNLGKSGKELVELVKNSMNLASLPFEEFGERQTFGLSGGEQRRLSIAGIIALNTDVILFDEPTAGLDTISRFNVMKLLRTLADQGKTVLFSTHRRDEADASDREIVIENGFIKKDTFADEFVAVVNEDSSAEEVHNALNEVIDDEKHSEVLELVEPYEAAKMISGLRSASSSLSGTTRKSISPVQKLSPVVRIVLFLGLFVTSLVVRPMWLCGLVLAVSALYGVLSGFSLKKLISACIKILPFLLFFSILQLMFHAPIPGEVHYTEWKWFLITPSKLKYCLGTILRTDASLACISAFFVSTPEYDLIDGLKIFLYPLTLIKIPVKYFILMIEIIFRFIPLLVDEAASIMKTQIIRGGLGKVRGFGAKLKAIVPLIVPLIVQTIKRSEHLADALTVRGFE